MGCNDLQVRNKSANVHFDKTEKPNVSIAEKKKKKDQPSPHIVETDGYLKPHTFRLLSGQGKHFLIISPHIT